MTSILLGFLLAFAESGLGLGAVLPGEVAISALAASAGGSGPTVALGTSVALGAVAGDHLGFLLGRRYGAPMRDSRLVVRMGVGRWDRAVEFVQSYGFWAVLGSRLLPVVRAVTPAVAGAAGMRYQTFLVASVLGAIAWASLWVGTGTGIASSGILDHPGALTVVGTLILAVVFTFRRVRRRRTAAAGSRDRGLKRFANRPPQRVDEETAAGGLPSASNDACRT